MVVKHYNSTEYSNYTKGGLVACLLWTLLEITSVHKTDVNYTGINMSHLQCAKLALLPPI